MKNLIFLPIFLFVFTIMNAQMLSKEKALADLDEFESLLKNESSYIQLTDFDYSKAIEATRFEIKKEDNIHIYKLHFLMGKIIYEVGDRHASVRLIDFDRDQLEGIRMSLPFAIAPMDGKIVALKKDKEYRTFKYYNPDFPFLEKINGLPVNEFIKQYIYRNSTVQKDVQFYHNLKELRKLGELFLKNNESIPSKLEFVFTDGKKQKTEILDLKKKRNTWRDIGSIGETDLVDEVEEQKIYKNCDRWLSDSIGYIALPDMVYYGDYPDFETYLNNTITKYKNAKSIIFDVRGNGGGTRHILNQLAPFIVQPEQSPWVANVARIRINPNENNDDKNLDGKFLYKYNSPHFDDEDRKAIDAFNLRFSPKRDFNKKMFTEPFYMVLRSGNQPFDCPIFILTNEKSFSAASIFASAFKGLLNVKLVGKNTDGSSGRSREFFLKNSNIRIKLSTMISFQRNGKTLDGNGTEPDIELERDIKHIFGKVDSQLQELEKYIKHNLK